MTPRKRPPRKSPTKTATTDDVWRPSSAIAEVGDVARHLAELDALRDWSRAGQTRLAAIEAWLEPVLDDPEVARREAEALRVEAIEEARAYIAAGGDPDALFRGKPLRPGQLSESTLAAGRATVLAFHVRGRGLSLEQLAGAVGRARAALAEIAEMLPTTRAMSGVDAADAFLRTGRTREEIAAGLEVTVEALDKRRRRRPK